MGNTIMCTEADKTNIQLSADIRQYTLGIKTTFKKVEHDENSFVDNYGKYYSSDCPKDENCPPYIRQTNNSLEKYIMEILDKAIWENADVFNVLAWKTGNIISLKNDEKIVGYKSNWMRDNDNYYARFPHQSDISNISEFLEKVCKCKNEYDNKNPINHYEKKKEANKIWNELVSYINEKKINGIGPVILLTIIFFVTKGELPIYDRFAMASLLSFEINNNSSDIIPFGSTIQISTFPDKSRLKDYIINENLYSFYRKLLSKYFSDWKNNRRIDQALWVYGHFFKVSQ